MRIVRPYGQSVTRAAGADDPTAQRRLRLRDNLHAGEAGSTARDIVVFAGTHDALVIAQWISAIDKIATKPRGSKRPSEAQRRLRQQLGDAAWAQVVEAKLLTGPTDDEGHLAKLWQFKIHPYPDGVAKPGKGRDGKPQEPPPEGRWYARFVGEVAPEAIDATAVARRIHEHLHEAAYRLAADRPTKRLGLIEARARSIAGNVVRPRAATGARPTWEVADQDIYVARVGNIAARIRDAAIAREAGEDGSRNLRVGPDVAAKVLYAAWADLFNGGRPSFEEAKKHHPGLVALHEAIRDRYRRTLKRHGKDQRAHEERRRKVSDLLPSTMGGLLALVGATQRNRDLAALVRLGKVIHYEAADRAGGSAPGDAPAHVVSHWPDDIASSRFWASDGQALIKRNEAFVRVWRHSLALARQTLTDWADPAGTLEADILLAAGIDQATGKKRFDPVWHAQKLQVLFGSRAKLLVDERSVDFKKATLRLALEGVAQLRHNAFHFNGLGGFTRALQLTKPQPVAELRQAITALWVTDLEGRALRLRQTMIGAHCDTFLSEAQNGQLFDAVFESKNRPADPALPPVPLPRFRRLLRRVAGIEGTGLEHEIVLRLPKPADRDTLAKQPARLCQYIAIKLLYEHPFRMWLGELKPGLLNGFIARAVQRAEEEARKNHAKPEDEDRRSQITAKARHLVGLAESETIQAFLFRLSAETASEMRVQNFYESDSVRAREQAGYIEDLRCDVLAQAFDRYLEEADFLHLTELPAEAELPPGPPADLSQLGENGVDASAEDWQKLLYFLLHLVPVDDVGRLLHQIRKWHLLAGKGEPVAGTDAAITTAPVGQLTRVLELYLDMHDAKFEGGAVLAGLSPFEALFESKASFEMVFPATQTLVEDNRVPRRGLREIARFGHLPTLNAIFRRHAVRDAQVKECLAAETEGEDGRSSIARAQAERERLHAQWVASREPPKSDGSTKPVPFDGTACQDYVLALEFVMWHRHLAAHVRLVDHVRLHRLMMAVLGRLVDFAGLWERDLYFTLLALLHEAGLKPQEVFAEDGDGLEKLSGGQIVAARNRMNAPGIEEGLARHFGPLSDDRVQVRNDLAHFNMINAAKSKGRPPDLTACVNAARQLMGHDRKLANAVAKSVIELLKRENLDLAWDIDAGGGEHRLTDARIAAREAVHLGGMKLPEAENDLELGKPRVHLVKESLHGDRLVDMVAALFAGTRVVAEGDVSRIPVDRIAWSRVNQPRKPGAKKTKGDNRRAHPGRKSRARPPGS